MTICGPLIKFYAVGPEDLWLWVTALLIRLAIFSRQTTGFVLATWAPFHTN
jgi:hypothetical protein